MKAVCSCPELHFLRCANSDVDGAIFKIDFVHFNTDDCKKWLLDWNGFRKSDKNVLSMKEQRSHERSDLVGGTDEDLGAVTQEIGKRGKDIARLWCTTKIGSRSLSWFSSKRVFPKKLLFSIWQVSEIIKALRAPSKSWFQTILGSTITEDCQGNSKSTFTIDGKGL